MAMDAWGVVKVKGSDPERFMIVGQDLGHKQGEPVMWTSDPMSEEELRKELGTRGMSQAGIEAEIKKGRDHEM
jgi:hypothetical protein